MGYKEENEGPDLQRIGLFKEMSYLHGTSNVPFAASFNKDSNEGKQMMTNCTKRKGPTMDGYFDKEFSRVFEGEAYTDKIRIARMYRLKIAEKILNTTFRPNSPTKKPSGKGSYFGTFTDYDKRPEHFSGLAREGREKPTSLKNVLTNPAKKGSGYGYPNITLSKDPPYFLEKDYEVLKAEKHAPQKVEVVPTKPFLAGQHPKDYFDPNPFFTEKPDILYEGRIPSEKIEKPFIPSSPAKKAGGMKAGCFEKFPPHEPDPYIRASIQQRGVKCVLNKENKMFLPFPGPKPYPIKSIIATNVIKRMNVTNYQNMKSVINA